MGLIMLILVGTVPTAYALNHAVGAKEVQTFSAVSTQVAGALSNYVEPGTVLQDAPADLERFISTKKYQPSVMLALQQQVVDIRNEAVGYGSLGNVPSNMQSNVRNQMYLISETLRLLPKLGPKMSAGDVAMLKNYKGFLDKSTKFIPPWVKVAVALALGLGTMVGWKRIVITVGEKIGKTHLTYAQGAAAEITAMITIGLADGYGLPGEYDACVEFRRCGHDVGKQKRSADVDVAGYCFGLGVYAARCCCAFGQSLLAVQPVCEPRQDCLAIAFEECGSTFGLKPQGWSAFLCFMLHFYASCCIFMLMLHFYASCCGRPWPIRIGAMSGNTDSTRESAGGRSRIRTHSLTAPYIAPLTVAAIHAKGISPAVRPSGVSCELRMASPQRSMPRTTATSADSKCLSICRRSGQDMPGIAAR